jgi:peptide-methionine (S)-S-oxide reductase
MTQHSMQVTPLGGGCFWCLEAVFDDLVGVESVESGYMGGHVERPTYAQVCGASTGHAEVIQVTFDPSKVGFRDILAVFFTIHDPTTKDRQGNDLGSSYRSAIFYVDDEQRQVALDTIADVDACGLWPGKVVTEVVPAADFWEAEPEHQDYLLRIPNGYTCHWPRPGWKVPKRETV